MWDRLAVKKAMTEEKVKLVHFNSVSLKKKRKSIQNKDLFQDSFSGLSGCEEHQWLYLLKSLPMEITSQLISVNFYFNSP